MQWYSLGHLTARGHRSIPEHVLLVDFPTKALADLEVLGRTAPMIWGWWNLFWRQWCLILGPLPLGDVVTADNSKV